MLSLLPWMFTIIAVTMSAVGHILYKYYAISGKLKFLLLTAITFVMIPGFSLSLIHI